MKRTLKRIDPSSLCIGREAPFRYRRTLPGETSGKACGTRGGTRGARSVRSEGHDATSAGAAARDGDAALVESIGRFGLINPPLLIDDPEKGDIVLSGHRRIAAAAVAGLCPVGALSLGRKNRSAEEIVSLWLEEARHGEPLSDLEAIVLTKKCRELSGASFDGFLGMLSKVAGRRLSIAYLERTWRLLELPGQVLDALHGGSISTGDLLLISESRSIDTKQAAALLAGASLTRKEQKQAIRLMLRIGDFGRDAWTEFARTIGKEGSPLLPFLSAACHPSLTRDRRRIGEIINGIGLPTDATIQPPENLEGGSYRLTVRIRNEEEFARILDKIGTAVQNGSISRLLSVLKGIKDK